MQVYLSGGMYSGWQEKMPVIENVSYFDPRTDIEQHSAISFVQGDIEHVKKSNLVFCYMEKSNPSGLGAAWECAIAYENNIPIITVWEKDYVDPFFACCSLYLLNNFEKGVFKLQSYIKNKINT